MGRLDEPGLSIFEEHLLVCVPCQNRLAEEDRCRQRIRDAATLWERQQQSRERRILPRLAWAYAAALLGLIALAAYEWPALRNKMTPQPVTSAVVVLNANRGIDTPAATAPPRRPLLLGLDLTGLQPSVGYRLEIVDSSARQVFQGEALRQANEFQVRVPRGLGSGRYFARLYSGSELLREYALAVSK